MPSTLPASDCRVNSLTAAATPQQPQVPWDLSSSAEHADIVAEQHTEVAAFARSPSPALDSPSSHHGSPDRHVDQAESGQGQNASRAAGQETVSSTAGPGALESSLQNNADLLASSKQLRATRDHASKQHKSPDNARKRKPHTAGTADIHMMGEITGAVGFGQQALYCTWQLVYDSQLWQVSKGLAQGRTHASSPLLPEDGSLSGVVWETPLDFVLTTTSIQHWPQIVFKLFHRSIWLGRDEFVGYSLCNLPITPGCHHLSCPVWAAVEARKSFRHEITSWLTGLTPQLVDERFITDLEQRYEQGQHLHTHDCSGSNSWLLSSTHAPASAPSALSVDCRINYAGNSTDRYCRSFCAAGGGGAAGAGPAGVAGAAAGGRICLRLHVVSRGLSQLRVFGGESVGKALERLRDSVDQMRRQQGQHTVHYDEEEEESEGVRLVREGRAARLAAAQQHLDGNRDRDQQHLRDGSFSTAAGSDAGGAAGSFSSRRGASPGRASPSRNSRVQYSGSGSPGSSWSNGRQYAGARETDAEANPSHAGRAGRLGAATNSSPNRQQSPSRFTTSLIGASEAGNAQGTAAGLNTSGTSSSGLGGSWRMSRESLGASRQQYGSPLRGRSAAATGAAIAGDAGDMEHRLPAPRFGVSAGRRDGGAEESKREAASLQEGGGSGGE